MSAPSSAMLHSSRSTPNPVARTNTHSKRQPKCHCSPPPSMSAPSSAMLHSSRSTS
jgi:hypothetical protein